MAKCSSDRIVCILIFAWLTIISLHPFIAQDIQWASDESAKQATEPHGTSDLDKARAIESGGSDLEWLKFTFETEVL